MRVCDICKTNKATHDTHAALDASGFTQKIETCRFCFCELAKRESEHQYLAYVETVEAITGKRPRKSHWWDRIEL